MQQRAPEFVVVASNSVRAHRLRSLDALRERRVITARPGAELEPLVRLLDPAAVVLDAAGEALASAPTLRESGYGGVIVASAEQATAAVRNAARSAGIATVVADADLASALPECGVPAHAPPSRGAAIPTTLRLGNAEVDVVTGTVVRDGQVSRLPARERTLLAALHRRQGAVVPRSTLLREVWGEPAPSSRVVDRHVARLRQRIEREPDAPEHIVTVFREGYRLAL